MSRIRLGLMILCCVVWSFYAETIVQAADEERPNILVVLCDDLGYGDLACYGHPLVKTPNLDKFATEGLRLTSCYSAAPNCSPARCGLMTGRTPFRVGVHNWISEGSPMHLRKREITIATLLRQAGYATAHTGKWHLNGMFNKVGQPQPPDHGFDYWFSTQNNALPSHANPINFVRNGKAAGPIAGYAGQIVAEEAIHWLQKKWDREKPFFLYVCFHEPHEPIATDKRFSELYPPKGKLSAFDHTTTSFQAHHGNITQMDDAFGRLMKTLDELKLREDTFIVFTSDNGPAITPRHPHGSAGPLRDKKGDLYEGGIRVPGMIRWPGHVKPGTVSDEPVCGVDLLPTLCELVGIPAPADRTLDGVSILPVLKDDKTKLIRKQPLYWQFNASHSKPKVTIRMGDWVLLATLTGPEAKPTGAILKETMENLKVAELDEFELYNVTKDIGQSEELSQQEPGRLLQMKAVMSAMYHDVRAESPLWPVWEWPRNEGRIIQELIQKERAAAERKQQEQQ